ncbi:hypothetical protein J1N35_022580, partial [Gossypium stocksii]
MDFMGDQIISFVRDFLNEGKMLKEINKTFIALLPKNSSPSTVSDCRPISLSTSIYKIISKILVSKLRPLLGDLISSFQNTFIKGRHTSDNGPGILGELKLDMNKAFDRLSWNFIAAVLKEMNFPNWWIHRIITCISTLSFQVL